MAERKEPIGSLFFAVALLMVFGCLTVLSQSFFVALDRSGSGYSLFLRQTIFVAVGLLVILWLRRASVAALEVVILGSLFLSIGGLIAIEVLPVATTVGGATRWLNIGGQRFQPVELYKFTVVFVCLLAWTLLNKKPNSLKVCLSAIILLGPLVLLLRQPDFGAVFFISTLMLGTFYVFGISLRYVTVLSLTVVVVLAAVFTTASYRMRRLEAFLNPLSDPQGASYQVIQALGSIQRGGLFGVGPGKGEAKYFYLPEAHTDFVLAASAEEFGFIGILILLGLCLFIFLRVFQISWQARDVTLRAICFVTGFGFALAVLFHAGVNLGLLPTKGMTFPLLSYGGSSVLSFSIAFGFVMRIERALAKGEQLRLFSDQSFWLRSIKRPK